MGLRITPPTVDDAKRPSLHSLERVDTTEHPQAAEGARVASGVGSLEHTILKIIIGTDRCGSGTRIVLPDG